MLRARLRAPVHQRQPAGHRDRVEPHPEHRAPHLGGGRGRVRALQRRHRRRLLVQRGPRCQAGAGAGGIPVLRHAGGALGAGRRRSGLGGALQRDPPRGCHHGGGPGWDRPGGAAPGAGGPRGVPRGEHDRRLRRGVGERGHGPVRGHPHPVQGHELVPLLAGDPPPPIHLLGPAGGPPRHLGRHPVPGHVVPRCGDLRPGGGRPVRQWRPAGGIRGAAKHPAAGGQLSHRGLPRHGHRRLE
mmetsp:Transcript_152747/g.266793  ORF Transcript_152747/g.266793 Transcript_152747/m.266793 type:complete len:242 (+) Transcript_152747:580-1305(+)